MKTLLIETNNEVVTLNKSTVALFKTLYEESLVSSRYVAITEQERSKAAESHFLLGALGSLGVAVAKQLFQLFSNDAVAV